jgi:hypothetical protein
MKLLDKELNKERIDFKAMIYDPYKKNQSNKKIFLTLFQTSTKKEPTIGPFSMTLRIQFEKIKNKIK